MYAEIIAGLYMGDQQGPFLGFDLIVRLTQPYEWSAATDGPAILCLPMNDGEVTPEEAMRIMVAASVVSMAMLAGKKVLVHCGAGLNRSGVVVARALMMRGWTAQQVIDRIRERRGVSALGNSQFVAWLHKEAQPLG